jgi:hypothetical protein
MSLCRRIVAGAELNFIAEFGGPWAGSRRVCFKSGAHE